MKNDREDNDDGISKNVAKGAERVFRDVFESIVCLRGNPRHEARSNGQHQNARHDTVLTIAKEEDGGQTQRSDRNRTEKLIAIGDLVHGACHTRLTKCQELGHIFTGGTGKTVTTGSRDGDHEKIDIAEIAKLLRPEVSSHGYGGTEKNERLEDGLKTKPERVVQYLSGYIAPPDIHGSRITDGQWNS